MAPRPSLSLTLPPNLRPSLSRATWLFGTCSHTRQTNTTDRQTDKSAQADPARAQHVHCRYPGWTHGTEALDSESVALSVEFDEPFAEDLLHASWPALLQHSSLFSSLSHCLAVWGPKLGLSVPDLPVHAAAANADSSPLDKTASVREEL
eukprot:m.96969 g.96969  ORF g.96969 m.96969 type:complete len:150 (-) comp8810_c0_seq1:207-656(-)